MVSPDVVIVVAGVSETAGWAKELESIRLS